MHVWYVLRFDNRCSTVQDRGYGIGTMWARARSPKTSKGAGFRARKKLQMLIGCVARIKETAVYIYTAKTYPQLISIGSKVGFIFYRRQSKYFRNSLFGRPSLPIQNIQLRFRVDVRQPRYHSKSQASMDHELYGTAVYFC